MVLIVTLQSDFKNSDYYNKGLIKVKKIKDVKYKNFNNLLCSRSTLCEHSKFI